MTRGRKPTPTHLKVVRGNPSKRPLNKSEPKPEGDLFKAPNDLPQPARRFWTSAIADAPAGLLKRLDGRVLFAWAVAAWQHSNAAREIHKDGPVLKGPQGGVYQNPYLSIANRQAMIMLRAAAEMGFTPSSRTRISIGEGGGPPIDGDFDEF